MAPRAVRACLLLAVLPAAASEDEAQCSGKWEDCSESMCCGTPFFQCIEKNPGDYKHEGKKLKAYAQCRFSNETDPCPCKKPPCIDYAHEYLDSVKVKKVPWTCAVLTGGCSEAFKTCGPGKKLSDEQKKNYKGKPCCQWGCTCDYNQTWNAQCQPPKGLYACTKEGQKKIMHGEAGNRLFTVIDDTEGVSAQTPQAILSPWLAAAGGAALVVMTAMVVVLLRKRRSHGPVNNEEVADAEAEAE